MKYIIFIQDETGKHFLVGEYFKLEDSIDDVNNILVRYGSYVDELNLEKDKTVLKYLMTEKGIISVRGFELNNS